MSQKEIAEKFYVPLKKVANILHVYKQTGRINESNAKFAVQNLINRNQVKHCQKDGDEDMGMSKSKRSKTVYTMEQK